MNSPLLIKKPIVTERTTELARLNKYVFATDLKASATEVKKLVEKMYGVKVTAANVINVKSKKKRLGRTIGRQPAYKKVILTLKEGDTIDIVPR